MSDLSETTAQELLTSIQNLMTILETQIENSSEISSRKLPFNKENYPELTWQEPEVYIPVELPDEAQTHLARGKNGRDQDKE